MSDTIYTELSYPRISEEKYIEVSLSDVRAADDIRIHYDFDRDGWSIEQASVFEWDGDDIVCNSDWQEVSFVKAWKRFEERNMVK